MTKAPTTWTDWEDDLEKYFILLHPHQRRVLVKEAVRVDGRPLHYQAGHKEFGQERRSNIIKASRSFKDSGFSSGSRGRKYNPLKQSFNPLLYLQPNKYIGRLTDQQYHSQFSIMSNKAKTRVSKSKGKSRESSSSGMPGSTKKRSSSRGNLYEDSGSTANESVYVDQEAIDRDVDLVIELCLNGRSAWPYGALCQFTEHDMVTADRCHLASTLFICLPLLTVHGCTTMLKHSYLYPVTAKEFRLSCMTAPSVSLMQ